ncbi:MAG: SDR family NAD(P)-dependent oxidoreductase, partial [Chloroflexi bacterium]|nr:SDR family NAD(P)-dependent oxidoreductase [Chloroflexota bacterium]
CDLSKNDERRLLYEWARSNFDEVNILVNNAGIQRMIDLRKGTSELSAGEDEIEVNLKACIHLSALFIPSLLKKKEAAIINVSSGLCFVPIATMPVYCATKAAIHSFTLSLRHQLRDTSVKVFEVIPPTVDTELDKGARAQRGQEDRGIPPVEVAQATLKAVENDQYEVPIGMAGNLRTGARTNPEEVFQNLNRW